MKQRKQVNNRPFTASDYEVISRFITALMIFTNMQVLADPGTPKVTAPSHKRGRKSTKLPKPIAL